jgi:hypothetical protein
MKRKKFSEFVKWFDDYVSSYNLNPKDQENIDLGHEVSQKIFKIYPKFHVITYDIF